MSSKEFFEDDLWEDWYTFCVFIANYLHRQSPYEFLFVTHIFDRYPLKIDELDATININVSMQMNDLIKYNVFLMQLLNEFKM